MVTCMLTLLAKGVIRDAETNTISIYQLIEEISAVSFPLFLPEATFFSYLTREVSDPTSFESVMTVHLDETKLVELSVKNNFEDKFRSRLIIRIGGLPVPKPGLLVVKLQYPAGEEICRYEVKVLSKEAPRAEVLTGA